MKLMSLIVASIILFPSTIYAKNVRVKGYYRKDGTYVKPHNRTSPDGVKWNNYGSPGAGEDYSTPGWQRDYDGDGVPNYLDYDDNNNGIVDDSE